MIATNLCDRGYTAVAGTCIPSPHPTPTPSPTSPGDGLGVPATVGLFIAVFMMAVGVAGVLFPPRRPRKWDQS